MAGFDYQGALNAGYSPSEILQHLDGDPNVKFDIRGALNAGYSPQEVLAHVGGDNLPPDTSYSGAFKQGVSNLEGGVGETLNQIGLENYGGKSLQAAAKNTAPA